MLKRDAPIPLYYQLKGLFLEQIARGTWRVGKIIPSETDLATKFSVSRATVRQALMELVQSGHLHRIQGKGTFVTEPKVEPIGALTSFTENMQAAGLIPQRKTLLAEWRTVPEDIAKDLQQRSGHAFYVKRLLIANDSPLALQKAWYPAWLIQGKDNFFTKKMLDQQSLYETLQTKCGVILNTADETIDVLMPDEEERKLLALPEKMPIMQIRRNTYDRAGRTVEAVNLLFRSDRYRYRVTLSRSRQEIGGRFAEVGSRELKKALKHS